MFFYLCLLLSVSAYIWQFPHQIKQSEKKVKKAVCNPVGITKNILRKQDFLF